MARLLFSDDRLVYRNDTGFIKDAAGASVLVYSSAAATTLADLATYDGTGTPGAAISGSRLTVDMDSRLPLFWGPDGVDTLWTSANGATVRRVYARVDDRLDALVASLALHTYSTAGRPSAVTSGAGATYYDTTLSKPGYSDGTVWRDAAGTGI